MGQKKSKPSTVQDLSDSKAVTTVIVVAGATGNVGFSVVQELAQLDGNVEIRALTRSSSGEKPALAAMKELSNVKILECNLSEKSSLINIFDGATAAFVVAANFHGQVEAEKNFIDAAVSSSSCKYLVKIGTVRSYTSNDSQIEYARGHAEIEEHLEQTAGDDMKWTVLCPNWFMTNHLADIFGTLPQNIIVYPVDPQAKVSMIDPRDVGAVAARLLLASDEVRLTHHALKLDISGPDEVTISQVAEMYTNALEEGRTVNHVKCSSDDYVAATVKAGYPEWQAEDISKNFPLWEAGKMVFPSAPQVMDLAPPKRTMEEWISEMVPLSPPPAN
eukprot:CAMPEP_0198267402 /NCGR_PEP_ID=MMETSP1447-20131203/32910_1 /TAXON_ID=420782 /ORGANISM="Chaetoceros dichaeta, Strain CCMP1751" /LENGTH=331 /DNA_ID=CAMNT_0043957985 /DNA_START=29 /DNA_END=1024 /DNA_ORIENTATION=-